MKAVPARWTGAAALTAVLMMGATLTSPAHAWLGALGKLGKLGSAAGKGAATKGAAAGSGTVAGAEALDAAGHAARAGGAAESVGHAAGSTASAEQLAKASGLGKAVPDDIAAMLTTPGKTLLDIPDAGVRSWLQTPAAKLSPIDADLMAHDYLRLLEGKAAAGPRQPAAAQRLAATGLPTRVPAAQVPWFAIELLARAAIHGHQPAQRELDRICRASTDKARSASGALPAYCRDPKAAAGSRAQATRH
ncbi:MAG: hypothetical protein EOO54_09805 [Haliea sp.]|nr:MAG: hypothetical protein EOO54_09805 [Haliea sp.]